MEGPHATRRALVLDERAHERPTQLSGHTRPRTLPNRRIDGGTEGIDAEKLTRPHLWPTHKDESRVRLFLEVSDQIASNRYPSPGPGAYG